MTCELLAPAGSYNIGLAALYAGADALYLGLDRFGARAYAKNFTLEELEKIVNIANVLGKKIYVTCNTLIKDKELQDAYELLNTIYKIGVHGVITTDYALINYVINFLPQMECHISTQVGIKCLEDVNYFTKLKAKRSVLARETNIDEIKRIKENSKMPIEVFIHGALCVSYSGNCFFSSLLTLRSGNRGRCAQNCRREYELYKDGELVSPKCYLLSTKDLNSFSLINDLKELKVDSLKIEGRMKDETYVKTLVTSYRHKLDDSSFKTDLLDKIFHREYTKGFLNNASNESICNISRSGNVGQYLGTLVKKNNLYELHLENPLKLKDRLRIIADKDYYIDVEEIYDKKLNKINACDKFCYLKLNINVDKAQVYIIKNRNLDFPEPNKIPLDVYLSIKENNILVLASFNNQYFNIEEKNCLTLAKTRGLNKNDFIKQFQKLQETPFYLNCIEVPSNINNYFLAVSQINNIRRNLINAIYNSYKEKRVILDFKLPKLTQMIHPHKLVITCRNKKQYDALKDYGYKIYFNDNYTNYNTVKKLDQDDLLVSNYGSIFLNQDKNLTLNKEFNCLNYHSLAHFLTVSNNVTLSQELSQKEIKELITNFYNHYHFLPNTTLIVYGHMTLMTLKYCPIKKLGYCGTCHKANFYIKDDTSFFPLLTDNNCITSILNGKVTNLIAEIKDLAKYITTFRLDFTIESSDECKRILEMAIDTMNGKNVNSFNSKTDTKGYLKREIL